MDNKINCICNVLYEINGFITISEFERFQKYISILLNNKELIEIPVLTPYSNFTEHWYQCSKCLKIWRLVHPDFPFKGIWSILLRINKNFKKIR